jgi:hypothetical protein
MLGVTPYRNLKYCNGQETSTVSDVTSRVFLDAFFTLDYRRPCQAFAREM